MSCSIVVIVISITLNAHRVLFILLKFLVSDAQPEARGRPRVACEDHAMDHRVRIIWFSNETHKNTFNHSYEKYILIFIVLTYRIKTQCYVQ